MGSNRSNKTPSSLSYDAHNVKTKPIRAKQSREQAKLKF